jgi:lysine 2,3-aminomutase
LPTRIPSPVNDVANLRSVKTRDDFLRDVEEGMRLAPMAVRLTPHILSVADWTDPLDDPIRRQFIPMASAMVPDHPMLTLDSLHEEEDSPAEGLVHRYPDKVLFLGKPSNVRTSSSAF